MKAHSELRLLPWSGPDGKPCYLSTDNDNSYLSRLADRTEEVQLGLAADLVTHAQEALSYEGTQTEELRCVSADLMDALRDVLRVAASRGRMAASTAPHGPRGR